MRLPRWLAWLLVVLAFFTAGLLRQFHDSIPRSPYVPAVVGSLLFAAIVFLGLVAARERQVGAVRYKGVRLGSLTPLLLMLLVEKWVSIALYNPTFYFIGSENVSPALLDAKYRTFAGAGLLAVCLLLAAFSKPAARRTWRVARTRHIPIAVVATTLVIAGTYGLLWAGLAWTGRPARLWFPTLDSLVLWILVGQAFRAFAEEIYYRGLLLAEMQRLAPRLGVSNVAARRWVALGFTSVLFGMEHLYLAGSMEETIRRLIFTVSLGLLFGLIVLMSVNIYLAVGLHTWMNWLLLSAAPRFTGDAGDSMLAPGVYIGVALMLMFGLILAAGPRLRSDR
ncbi:MAG: CPBP family intramembrane glutamic endopeptidase [Acidobacteriota bacterium]|nr:CPBP family intramembrane glutamic endopeptidase [Acidobacteriota bacterium]